MEWTQIGIKRTKAFMLPPGSAWTLFAVPESAGLCDRYHIASFLICR